jgi:probable F420-dependent oxidoreductase
VRLGFELPQRLGTNLSRDVTELARQAEATGFTSLWVYERLLFPVAPLGPLYGIPELGNSWPDSYKQAAEPLAVLTAAAAVTSTVRLGTGLLVAPLHHPVQLAKSLATIDQISGGRLIAGLGLGWSDDEMHAVGTKSSERARSLEEMLDVFSAVWGPDPVNYRGSAGVIANAYVLPKPVKTLPVYIGGGYTSASQERIAKRADGWIADGGLGPEAAAGIWSAIRQKAADANRDAEALAFFVQANIVVTAKPVEFERRPLSGSVEQVVEDLAAYARVGAHEIILNLQLDDSWPGTEAMWETAREVFNQASVV